MSGEPPKCRVIVAHRFYKYGDIIAPGAMLRNDLLRRGWIELLPEPVAVAEASTEVNGDEAAVEELTETKELPKRRRRRRKDDSE